jgi:hypothetical protein
LQEVKHELEAQAPKGAAPDPFVQRRRELDGSAPEDTAGQQADPVT